MNESLEGFMRKKYGSRYDLSRDMDGLYAREIVRRMFEAFCYAKGVIA